jgi:hypothetical protein
MGLDLATVLDGRLFSPRDPTEHETHIGASENAGGSPCTFYAVLFSSASQYSQVPAAIVGIRLIYPALYWNHVAQTA